MRDHVPYIPGHMERRVTNEDQTPRIPRPSTRNRSPLVMDGKWGARGILAVAAVLALSMIADGATLMFLAWATR